ncbi:AAA family ATPase, partial [Faecalibaculum rodentium]|uniref:AAA family ATPase n=1 Tax=Faecalibaculum rodentium TaxID=1702221 RepID=UPI00338DCD23
MECQILIIDESSMIDTHLFASLILALPDDCRLLMIGDEDQLESVGPGRVFQDLIDSGRIPAVHLERIWRQSEGSGIITLAREIRDEETCTWEDGVTYLDLPEERILDAILEDVDPEMDPDRFQVLAPMYKGAAGIEAVNEALQNVFNPPRAGCPELT